MRRIRSYLVWLFLLAAACAVIVWHWIFGNLPDPITIEQNFYTPSIRITDRNGRLLYEALGENGGRHIPLPADQIPECFIQATVATEDARFFDHPGVDGVGILRAIWINLQGGETLAGGSTITQQVARNLLLNEEERTQITIRRKLREAYLAWRLTQEYEKEEILAFYLNESNYGSLAYGIEAAAQTYFSHPAKDLTVAECALIAGLPQAPALYNPFVNFESAKERQEIVLGLMANEGYLTEEEALLATKQPIILTSAAYPFEAPHFVIWVLGQFDALISESPKSEALTIRTTLDLDWQHLGETAIKHQLDKLANTPDGLGHNVNSAALVAIDPNTGQILTMIGSPDYENTQIEGAVNMALAARQPGSALKPFIYALAFSNPKGPPWTAGTSILDVQTSFVTQNGESYVPANYDQSFNGPISARVALASSLNIPAVLALDHVGLENFFQFLQLFGLDDFGNPGEYDLSIALGGGEVRLLDLTAAYSVFANRGQWTPPYAILDITTYTGQVLYTHQSEEPKQIIDERIAWLISDILNDNEARSLGFGLNSILRLDRPAAVKTGTTSNFHDNWTIGFTPQLVVGVWAGNADYQPMRKVSGVSGAAPIWHSFIRSALADQPESWYPAPEDMVQTEICTNSGLLPGSDCPYHSLEWYIEGTQPRTIDTLYHRVVIDADTGLLANETTPVERQVERLSMDLPPAAHPWARQHNILIYSELTGANLSLQLNQAPISVVSPASHSKYIISTSIPIASQKLHFEASSNLPLKQMTFLLDGIVLAILEDKPYSIWWHLEPGEHTLRVIGTDLSGNTYQSSTIYFSVQSPSP
jgi:penicillin-binding protein 1C